MLERLIGEHITLHLDLSTELCPVRANRGHLEQVITNLSVNARDAQPDGGQLFIKTRNVEIEEARPGGPRPGGYVLLSVRDTGSGMDATTQARIFEPFFTTKEKGKGTGLGLSTVYGIVTQSDGHIAVASRPGHGTTFEIYLPRALDAVEPDVETTLAEPVGGSETILVVEDDDEVRRLAVEILAEYGYRVMEAKNGEGALQIFEHHAGQIDLVVTDVVMPAMGGRELSHHVGRSGPATRIVFMSGYPGEMTIPADAPDAGLFFLAKPFAPRALADKVREALDTPKSTAVKST
jgi:two-component system, cell cycle sensor histidine kinase and response regulator CckA